MTCVIGLEQEEGKKISSPFDPHSTLPGPQNFALVRCLSSPQSAKRKIHAPSEDSNACLRVWEAGMLASAPGNPSGGGAWEGFL